MVSPHSLNYSKLRLKDTFILLERERVRHRLENHHIHRIELINLTNPW